MNYLSGIGGQYLGKPGEHLGSAIGAFGSYLTGHGDYKVNSNSLFMGTPVPTFHNGKRSVIVKHKEFLQDISSSILFNLSAYSINPGLSTSFPFLSGIAENFEQYKIHGMVFEFVSTSADALNSVNTALGVVVSATEYNVNRANFINKQQMEAYEFSVSSKPSLTHVHPIECAPDQTPNNVYYIRTGAVPASEDLRLYDLGKYQIATVGSQAAAVVGELWVSYEVEFFKPLLLPTNYSSLSAHIGNASPTSTDILGPIQRAVSGSLALTVTATGAGFDTINFPPNLQSGSYSISFTWYGGSAAVALPTFTLTNMTAYTFLKNGTSNGFGNGSTTTTQMIYQVYLTITAAGAKIVLSSGTFPTSMTWVDIAVLQVSPSMIS